MPSYTYKCSNCDFSFEIVQSIKDRPKKKCKECKKMKLKRVLFPPMVFVKGDPATVGQLADRNNKKLGKTYLEEKRTLHKESGKNSRKEALESKLPRGMSLPENTGEESWYNSDRNTTNKDISNMTQKEKANYIMKGKK